MQWEQLADGLTRCKAHGAEFRLPASCPQCADADPATFAPIGVVDLASDSPDADGCQSPAEHERSFTLLARSLSAKAAELKKGTPRELPVAAKFYELSIRARRAAAELSNERHRRARVARMERDRRAATKGRRS